MNKIKEFVIDILDRNRLTKSIIVFCYEFYIWIIKRPMLEHTGIDFAGVEVPVVVNEKEFNFSGRWIADMEITETRPLWYSYNGKKEKTIIRILANKEIGIFTIYKPKWYRTFLNKKNKFNKLLRRINNVFSK
tara:strand:- start:18425 stop:18823 length:399 start_codon:yes stop_codon:yes gene_type:complete